MGRRLLRGTGVIARKASGLTSTVERRKTKRDGRGYEKPSERRSATARRSSGKSVWSIAHHIDVEWMYCAWELTRKDGAVGIDGVEAEEYERNLWENLQSLADRLKSGLYRAPAVKRVYIPKAGSSGPEVREKRQAPGGRNRLRSISIIILRKPPALPGRLEKAMPCRALYE
jgi:hypothetical protein